MIEDENLFMKNINRKQVDAFRLLFREFYRSLVYFAMRYVGDRETGEDIVQELFARLWEGKTKYASFAGFKTFLYNSVRNASLDYLKHKEVEEKFISCQPLNEEEGKELDLKIMQEELYRVLLRYVEELPLRRKEVFKLYLEGKKNEEIARSLKISPETVKTAKKESIRFLKEKMGKVFYLLCALGMI